jgi:hypothetical protein
MAWEIKDEWIDLAQAKHVVVFHNRDVMIPADGKMVPLEHHLINDLRLSTCPHCGQPKPVKTAEPKLVWDLEGTPVAAVHHDFKTRKRLMHEALNAHHQALMEYRGQHPHVRIGTGPKQ